VGGDGKRHIGPDRGVALFTDFVNPMSAAVATMLSGARTVLLVVGPCVEALASPKLPYMATLLFPSEAVP